MGLRFRKSKKIAPSVRFNISKSGFGLSAGPRGAKVSVNSKGRVTWTIGIPGSGLSYSTTSKLGQNINEDESHKPKNFNEYSSRSQLILTILFMLIGIIALIMTLLFVLIDMIGMGIFTGIIALITIKVSLTYNKLRKNNQV